MMTLSRGLTLALATVSIGCSSGVDLDEVPVGAEVQLVRDDGALVEGTLAARTEEQVTVESGATTRDVPRTEIVDLKVVEPDAPPPPPPPAATFREVTVPAGTTLAIELGTTIDTGTSAVGDPVEATLAEAVMVEGSEVLPARATVSGQVASVQAAGKVKGRASLALAFESVYADGESYPIAARFEAVAPATKTEDAKTIGIPAAGGAVLGAILGGKKGAAVGAAIGGGAGAGAVLMTPGDEVRIATGTTLSVAIGTPIVVKVPIRR